MCARCACDTSHLSAARLYDRAAEVESLGVDNCCSNLVESRSRLTDAATLSLGQPLRSRDQPDAYNASSPPRLLLLLPPLPERRQRSHHARKIPFRPIIAPAVNLAHTVD
jgi:hypothetical protein